MDDNVKTSASVMTITPEYAKTILETQNDSNRPIRSKRVDYYAEMMKKGQWKLNGEPICFDKFGVLVNGQHRLCAVVKANVPIDFLVVHNVEDGSYSTYDNGLNRKTSDSFAYYNIPNSAQVSSVVRKFYLLSINDNINIVDGSLMSAQNAKMSNQDLLNTYSLYSATFQWATNYAAALSNNLKLFTISEIGGVISYLVIGLEYDKDLVCGFMDRLFQYKTDKDFNSCKLLRERIVKSSLSKVKLSSRYKQNLLVRAWEHYLTATEVKVLKVQEDEGVLSFSKVKEELIKIN